MTGETPFERHEHRLALGTLALIFLAFTGMVLSIPVQLPGDGHEYLGTVASLLHSHNMTFEREDLLNAAPYVSPETFFVDGPYGQNTKVNPFTGKRMWGSHSFYVALLAIPFVLVFQAKGFLVLNVVCLVLMLWFFYLHLRSHNNEAVSLCLALACVLLSGVPSYVFWINSEMILMAGLCGALYYGSRFKAYRAMLFLGVATAIKPPLVLVFFPLALWQYMHCRSIKPLLGMGLLFCLVGLSQVLYDVTQIGRFGTLRVPGAAPKAVAAGAHSRLLGYATPLRFWVFWFAMGNGTIWFYPALFWCMVRNRFPWWMFTALVSTILIISVACLLPVNLFSTEAGVRYATLLFPLFLFMAGRWKSSLLDWTCMALVAFLGGALAMDVTHNIRAPQQIFSKAYPSMYPVRHLGLSLYPEVFFHSGFRLPRDVVTDYCDDRWYLRNDIIQLALRNVTAGDEAVLKLLPDEDAPDATVTYGEYGGPQRRALLQGGRVTTLNIPLAEERLDLVAYPDWRGRSQVTAWTARIELALSQLHVISGVGELRWQTRYHGDVSAFLYEAGPVLMNVYPSRAWILQTLASEDLKDQTVHPPGGILAASREGMAVQWAPEDRVEGTAALRLGAPVSEDPRTFQVFMRDRIPLTPVAQGLTHLEIEGFTKVQALQRHPTAQHQPKVSIVVHWLDAEGQPLQPIWVWSEGGTTGWQRHKRRIEIPEGAREALLSFNFEHGGGVALVDDVVVSWFQDTWRLPPPRS